MAGDGEDVPRGIRSRMVTLTGLLTQAWEYVVPPFQRPYSWTEEEVDCLVEDLRVATAFNYPYYFMGHIIVQPEDANALVIDGQQRLMTLTILLAYLRDRTENKALHQTIQTLIMTRARNGAGIRLHPRPMDRDMFRTHVQQPGQIDALVASARFEAKPQLLIQRAAKAIAEALDDKTTEERDALADFMLRMLTFNLIETTDLEGVSALFRVVNHRGQRPSDSSIIKSELLAKANFDDEEASQIADRWDSLEDDFDERGMAEFWSMIEVIVSGQATRERNPRSFRARVIDQVDARKFLREDLWRYEYALRLIQQCDVDAGEASEEVNRRLACMQLYKERSWLAPAVAMVADHPGDADFMRAFFLGLDRLTFACVMSVIRNQGRFERFARVVRARGNPRELFGADGALELSQPQVRQVIARLNAPINVDDDRGRIICYRLNAALPDGKVLSTRDDATLEHILPKADTEYWRKKFPDEKARKEYTYLIGNFCLLRRKQNDDAANKDWPEKRKVYFESRGAPIRALTATVRDVSDWNEVALRQRHVYLVGVLCEDMKLV